MTADRKQRKPITKTKADPRCPQCGAPKQQGKQKNAAAHSASEKKDADREYDNRGVLMPRRTRVGGIIMPQ